MPPKKKSASNPTTALPPLGPLPPPAPDRPFKYPPIPPNAISFRTFWKPVPLTRPLSKAHLSNLSTILPYKSFDGPPSDPTCARYDIRDLNAFLIHRLTNTTTDADLYLSVQKRLVWILPHGTNNWFLCFIFHKLENPKTYTHSCKRPVALPTHTQAFFMLATTHPPKPSTQPHTLPKLMLLVMKYLVPTTTHKQRLWTLSLAPYPKLLWIQPSHLTHTNKPKN